MTEEKKVKGYFKWLFTRWYLYVLSIFFILIEPPRQAFVEEFLGGFLAYLIYLAGIITIIHFSIKLFHRLFPKKN